MSVSQAALTKAASAYLGVDVGKLVSMSWDDLKNYIISKAAAAGISAAGNALGDALKQATSGSSGTGDSAPSSGSDTSGTTDTSSGGAADPAASDPSAVDTTPNSADTSDYVGDPSSV